MKTLSSLCLLLVLASGLLGCAKLTAEIADRKALGDARARVGSVLEGLRTGERAPGTGFQTSLCLWYNDTIFISDTNEQSDASDGFDRWTVAGGIDSGIGGYEITAAEIERDAAVPTVLVSGTVDDKAFQVRVPEKQSIEWVRRPGNRV